MLLITIVVVVILLTAYYGCFLKIIQISVIHFDN